MSNHFEFFENERLKKQLDFIVEIDKLKSIERKSLVFDGNRFENDAEHSWTISVLAVLLKEYANFKIDIEKVLVMLLIHDIVEVYAGDTFLYSKKRETANVDEAKSAERIFGFLDADQKNYFIGLWNEFEEKKTNEAKFATVFDRLEPLLQNYMTKGHTWKKNKITYEMVISKNSIIREGSEEIWSFAKRILEASKEKGFLPEYY